MSQALTDFCFRRLQPSDLTALGDIYKHTDGPSLSFLHGLLDKPSGRAWCALTGEQVVAVIWLNLMDDEAEIIDIRVEQAMRGRGIGGYLLTETLDALNLFGIIAIFLEVRRSNSVAITLYEQAGFATIGTRKDYYATSSGREDALVMRLDSNKR